MPLFAFSILAFCSDMQLKQKKQAKSKSKVGIVGVEFDKKHRD